jgi:hypothetical protein
MSPQYLALGVSICAFIVSALSYRERRQSERRDLSLKVHENMTSLDLQRGRRLLFEATDAGTDRWWQTEDEARRDEINRALAMLDVMGWLKAQDHLDDSFVFDIWGWVVVRAWAAAKPYVEWRREVGKSASLALL